LFVPAELAVFGQAIGEAVTLANHSNILYKTGKAAKKIEAHTIKSVSVLAHKFEKTELATFKKDLEKGRLIAEAVNNVREWVTAPPNITTPELLEEIAVKLGKENGYKVTVFKKKQIEKMRMGGIIGVNQGSPKEARLLVLEHRPKGSENEKPVVIVGKGIIFDTGGINLKPTGYIEDMQLDMAGAAATIGLFQLLKKLDIKVPVVGITPVTENCISGTAQKPSEIITMYNGKTVEVGNTDAEGRLVLADALAYGVDIFKPRYLLDFATLTGACMVALGRNYAGLFSTDDDLTEGIKKAAQEIAEPVWPLPLHKEFNKAMRGEVTDLTNSSKDRYGGASKGAAFLQEFVGKAKWAHLDIAGPAFTEQPHSHQSKRGTGFGVRLALRFLENLATTDANMEE
jgi:leucyl aminopeptidase